MCFSPKRNTVRFRTQQRTKYRRIISLVLAVNMLYSNLLVLHAGAAEPQVYCGKEAHTHTADACYAVSQTLICENAEEGHVHDDACYEDDTVLICAYPEASHTHTEACWLVESTQNCTYHEHAEACFTTEETMICGVTVENHVHTEDCEESEAKLSCGITEQVHTHDDACYTDSEVLSCQEHAHTQACRKTESLLTCLDTTEEHEHDDTCYTTSETLVCEYPESTHEHTDNCWRSEPTLSCDLHEHTDACYTTTWSCGVTVENHVHTEACSESQAVLTCEITEQVHEHDDSCYTYDETLVCQEHVHAQECSEAKLVLACELEEHVHELSCYANPDADLETAETWEADLPESLSGNWREDLLAVVNSQLGYQESSENYLVESDGETLAGYNRYGAWYGSFTQDENQPYAPWNVTFLFFSLYYAQIADLPLEETCADWIDALDYYGLYFAADAYTPTAGDLAFADTDGDGEADRAGVVAEIEEQMLTVIEGDADGKVAEVIYDLSVSYDEETEWVIGYADMGKAQADAQPENSVISDLMTWTINGILYLDSSALNGGWEQDGTYTELHYKKTDNTWTSASMTKASDYRYEINLPDDMNLTSSEFRFRSMNAAGSCLRETGNQTLQTASNEFVLSSLTGSSVAGAWKARTIYLDTSALGSNSWEKDNAVIRLKYHTASGEWKEMDVTSSSGTLHTFVLPDDMDTTKTFQFIRKNPADLGNEPWNYTPELTLQDDSDTYKLSVWSEGEWTSSTDTETPDTPEITHTTVILDTSPVANGDNTGWEAPGDDGGPVIWFYYNDGASRVQMTKVDTHKYEVTLPDDMDRTKNLFFWRRSHDHDYDWNDTPKTTLHPSTNEYVLDTADTGHWKVDVTEVDTLPEIEAGKRRVFFDATLSKMIYPEEGNGAKAIPVGDSKLIYCGYAGSESGTIQMTKLTSYTSGVNTWKDVYFADIPESATTVKFYSGSADSTAPDSTGELSIPTGYSRPCFYADNSDDSIYKTGTAYRGGYWGEVFTIRNAGAGKNSDVVDIAKENFTKVADRLYLSTTFYDWYSDYELNGFNRDINKAGGSGLDGAHELVPFRQLNQALSDVYSANSVSKPIYVGDFESGASYMGSILSTLDLYGRNNGDFYTNNNSGTDKAKAVQGLVGSNYSNGLKAADSTLNLPLFDESFIGGSNSKNTVLGEVYHNVAFPFEKKDVDGNGVDYWVYNSNARSLAMQQDPSGQYYLKESGTEGWSDNLGGGGFGLFPFNAGATNQQSLTYNYGYGARIDLTFRLTEDGRVLDSSNNKQPIEFAFSGDDDVWVFIDGKLALDIGGAHAAVSGTIDFSGESTTKNVTVSGVKVGSSSSTFEIDGTNTDEHTLTMFYVERGLYDSNMYIQFNFPDENELEVEKNVDTSEVDGDFHSAFNNQSLYTFNIKNLATHYGAKDAAGSNATPVEVNIAGSTLTPASISTGEVTAAAAGNVFEQTDSGEIHWRALYDDADSSHRAERYGTIELPSPMNLGSMRSLEFKIKSDVGMSLSKMYLDLLDSSGKAMGCLNGYLSGKTMGTVSMTAGEWTTVKLDLSKLSKEDGFDLGNVQAIRFGYDEEQDIYLKDFYFQPTATIPTSIGFVTEQSAIADYGSSGGNELKNAVGAIYLSQKESGEASGDTAYVVGTDGNFVLENGETASFRDQFRRGSYIYLEEVLNDLEKQLYDTSWTMYDDDIPVTAFGTGNTVTNGSITSLSGIVGEVVRDGRTEKTDNTTISGGYNGTAPANSFVFRSYANPDNTATTTKLKVEFTNKVKTGSLTIRKEDAGGNVIGTDKEFTFKVDFYNVGGLGLESQTITKTFTLKVGESKTISGIPLNTEYSIYEIKPTVVDGEADITLKEVIDNTANGSIINYTITTYGDSDAYMVSGVVDENGTSDNVTFRNVQKPMVSLELTKLWKDGETTVAKENTPSSINLRLLRRVKDSNDEWEPANDFYNNYTFTPGYGSWTYTFEPLEKYVDYTAATQVEWEYKVVELDGNGNVIAEGGTVTLENKDYTVSYGAVTDENSDGVFEQTITNRIGSKVSITVTKEWKDFNGDILKDKLPNFGFPDNVDVVLQRKTSSETTWTTVENTRVALNANNQWTHTYRDLDADYDYQVVEMHPNDGTVIANEESLSMAGKTFKVTYGALTPVAGSSSEYTQTITNTLVPTVMIDITKKSATEDKVLEGVVFKLEKQNGNTWSAAVESATDKNGFLRFAGLLPGKYRLTETKAASGYSLLKAPIEITISDAYEVTIPNINGTTSRGNEDGNFAFALTIYNQKSLVMPATGGVHGFEFWILGGLCIMAVPLLLYTFLGYRKGGKKLRK